jgi:hypothetical protein
MANLGTARVTGRYDLLGENVDEFHRIRSIAATEPGNLADSIAGPSLNCDPGTRTCIAINPLIRESLRAT